MSSDTPNTTADKKTERASHVVLTSHPGQIRKPTIPIEWGAKDAMKRGPVVASLTTPEHRNAIGTHSGSYTIYRALAMSAGKLLPDHRPDLTNTAPVESIGPHPSWMNNEKIVSIDPWGAVVAEAFKPYFDKGYDIRPSIAVTKAHIMMYELIDAIQKGRLKVDGEIIRESLDVSVTKAAVDPVWFLPAIAERFKTTEGELRKTLFTQTGGMFPELVTRPDLKVFLPPIGSTSIYIFGDVKAISDPKRELTVRVHDECNGSDVFGSDICTCRPYLVHGIEEAIKTAQKGGAGVVVYYRKEGRALGEVTKFLVYNARKRQEGGDSAATYFHRTECVAGVQDMRFQELMPDVLHWLGITRIDNFVSMSDMKHDAIVRSGIQIINRVAIPDDLIPKDAQVEMEAKKAAGYFTPGAVMTAEELKKVKGRKLDE
jgi:GTP cyclohydrolase II